MGRQHVNQALPGVGKSQKRKEDEQGQYALLLFHTSTLSMPSSRAPLAITVCSRLLTTANNKQALEKSLKRLKSWNQGEGAKDCLVGVHRQPKPALLPIYRSQLQEMIKALSRLSEIFQHPLTRS